VKVFTIGVNDAGQRLDRFEHKVAPALPPALLQRYIRIKRVKVNKKRADNARILKEGDLVELYVNDEFFPGGAGEKTAFLQAPDRLCVIYEDENILVADKPQGLVVHEDEGSADTLIARIQRHLYEAGEYNPKKENSFAPALANRIDRNTGGIVTAAKNAAALRVLNALFRERLVKKTYLAVVHGHFEVAQGILTHYIRRDETKKQVEVFDTPKPLAKTAKLGYHVLGENGGYSLLEIELFTGRTHQIRAQMAHIGHALLGDAKYGRARDNRESGYRFQALYAYRMTLDAGEHAEHLAYLNQKTFEVKDVWFCRDFYEGKLGR
jgi:23S rRNA pseudouridine955/2504/2580 synthase